MKLIRVIGAEKKERKRAPFHFTTCNKCRKIVPTKEAARGNFKTIGKGYFCFNCWKDAKLDSREQGFSKGHGIRSGFTIIAQQRPREGFYNNVYLEKVV